jgi:UDPglucose 6-dehydrogenase
MTLIEATVAANERQKLKMVDKITLGMGEVDGKTIAVLGITFKPNTDDVRDAPSLVIIPELIKRGAKIRIYDPQGKKEGGWRLAEYGDSIKFCENEYDAVNGSHATVILTEWNQFRNMDIARIKNSMAGRYFFDFRNIYRREDIEKLGLVYTGVGV